jgi:hypothetical protein
MSTPGANTSVPRCGVSLLGATRRAATVVLASVVSLSSACYSYTDIPASQPVVEQRVEFHINDVGRVQLARDLGPGARTVEGRVVDQAADVYTVAVFRITNLRGDVFTWSGEQVQVPMAAVETVMRRDLDRRRSVIAVASAAGAFAVFVMSRSLLGGGREPGEGTPPPPSTSFRW